MAIYTFEHKITGEIREISMPMAEYKPYAGENGDEKDLWQRIWELPALQTGAATPVSRLNPWDGAAFSDNMADRSAGKWTMGDAAEASRELSMKRAERNGGVDPIVQKHKEDYKKKTGKDMVNFNENKQKLANMGFDYKKKREKK